jgi:hypothetical protein
VQFGPCAVALLVHHVQLHTSIVSETNLKLRIKTQAIACPCTCHLQVQNGALLIPAGVYRITKTLDTRKSVVLRGAGKGLTTLYFPFSLTDVYGNTWSEVGPIFNGSVCYT